MFDKIHFGKIIGDHLKTFRNANTNRVSLSDCMLFIGLPIVTACLIIFIFEIQLSESLVNILITSLSIFVGLLLNLLVIVFDIINKLDEAKNTDKLKKKFLKEIYANISFSILISIVNIAFLIITLTSNTIIKLAANIIADSILFIFALTLLMILKRVHILLSSELNKDN